MSTFLAGLLLLAVLVVIHEFGHFIVAKWCGVRVLTFSVGFGPKIASFTRGDTEYCISIIPLGGYVRMYGDQIDEEVPEEEKKYSFLHQPVWKKSAIAFAGPLFNFILPIFLFFFVFLGAESYLKPIVGTVLKDSPAQKAGFLEGDTILAIDGDEVDNFTAAAAGIGAHPEEAVQVRILRSSAVGAKMMELQVVPESVPDPNPLNPGEKIGRIGISPASLLPLISVAPGSPAYGAGLRNGDVVKSVDGKQISTFEKLVTALHPSAQLSAQRADAEVTVELTRHVDWRPQVIGGYKKYGIMGETLSKGTEGWISNTREKFSNLSIPYGISYGGLMVQDVAPDSVAAGLGLSRGDSIHFLDGQPMTQAQEVIEKFSESPEIPHVMGYVSQGKAQVAAFRLMKKEGGGMTRAPDQYVLGVVFAQGISPGKIGTNQVGPGGAFLKSLEATKQGFIINLKSLYLMATFQVSADNVGGPIAIFGAAGQAAEQGASVYIFIMCIISIGLGILNLLPIPALDGGHLLMFFLEAIQGRPLSAKTRGIATQIGITLLLMLMGFAIFNDLSHVFG